MKNAKTSSAPRQPFIWLALFAALACAAPALRAQTAEATAAAKSEAADAHRARPIVEALQLPDAAKAAQVQTALIAHFAALAAWHEQHDAQIKPLWRDFAAARTKKDEAGQERAFAEIAAVYAGFKPQHDAFLAGLGAALTPAQIETVENKLTMDRVDVMNRAYPRIFPGLTGAQKAVILQDLRQARDEAIDAGSKPEISDIFKKYWIRIAAYLTAQGYNVPEAYHQFDEKMKAEGPAKPPRSSYEKHVKPILKALQLDDAAKAKQVGAVIETHYDALTAWHHQNGARLKQLWEEFGKARAKQDQAGADQALAEIDAVYATFKPQHDAFLAGLGAVLTPAQVEKVEDGLTVNKVEVTYRAYQQIFPGLTAAQNAVILQNLQLARNEAIDAESMTEKSAFFKKYKIRMEAYLTAQGYDVKQCYRVFVAKQKAEIAAKKAAGE